MGRFVDAIADAYLIPDNDGNVRFALSMYHGRSLSLGEAEAEGLKVLWTPLVRFYLVAAHACILIGFLQPYTGVALLLALWLARFGLFEGITRRYSDRLGWRDGPSELYRGLSHSISRPAVILLLTLAVFVPVVVGLWSWLATPQMTSYVEPLDNACLTLVALRWTFFFSLMINDPIAKEIWARPAGSGNP